MDARNASGDTPLLFLRANQYAIGIKLLDAGADPSVHNFQGNSLCDVVART